MFVVAGLGNPGLSYEKTRHNAGFLALDRVAAENSIRVTKRGFSGLYGEGVVLGERVLLIKPQTYMNLSGNCVQQVMHFYRVPPERLVVIYDDIDLPVGTLRIRASGSAGTHNGMRSVIACVGSQDFPRIRIGMGRDPQGQELKDYVLHAPSAAEQELLDAAYRDAAAAVRDILAGDLAGAQARYNGKH